MARLRCYRGPQPSPHCVLDSINSFKRPRCRKGMMLLRNHEVRWLKTGLANYLGQQWPDPLLLPDPLHLEEQTGAPSSAGLLGDRTRSLLFNAPPPHHPLYPFRFARRPNPPEQVLSNFCRGSGVSLHNETLYQLSESSRSSCSSVGRRSSWMRTCMAHGGLTGIYVYGTFIYLRGGADENACGYR